MRILPMVLLALTKIPLEKLLVRKRDPMQKVERLENILNVKGRVESPVSEPVPQQHPQQMPTAVSEPKEPQAAPGVSNEDTIAYQKREVAKEILLLEKHLQQKCKILGRACDCCEKHIMPIEGLTQEALGMTGDPLYSELIEWVRSITNVTTTAASASGEYDEQYAALAVKARDFRKVIMGTAAVKALLTPELSEKVSAEIKEVLDRALKDEGGSNDNAGQ